MVWPEIPKTSKNVGQILKFRYAAPAIPARFQAFPRGAKMPHGLFPPDIAAAGKL
ncbi:hypothetical protein [Neorhizobium sp. DT-125]|uniref:hypothetical protein n=1 Tax=Neorhizobium sp. DT-125 TaxID=3396163 RepID=UPI003F1B9636